MFGTLRASPGLFAWGTHAFCPPANVPARGGEWALARLQTILSPQYASGSSVRGLVRAVSPLPSWVGGYSGFVGSVTISGSIDIAAESCPVGRNHRM